MHFDQRWAPFDCLVLFLGYEVAMYCTEKGMMRVHDQCIQNHQSCTGALPRHGGVYTGCGHRMFNTHINPTPTATLVFTPGCHSVSPYHTRKPGVGCVEPSASRSTHLGRMGVCGGSGRDASASESFGTNDDGPPWAVKGTDSGEGLYDPSRSWRLLVDGSVVVGSAFFALAVPQIQAVTSPVAVATWWLM